MKRDNEGKGFKAVTEDKEQLKYLAQSVALEEATHPKIVRMSMMVISFAVVAFIVWSGFTKVNEVARAAGEVVPSGFVQTVQQYDGGIISSIDVKEGDLVEKGHVLLTLDGTGAKQDLAEAEVKQGVLNTEAARLEAIIKYAEEKGGAALNTLLTDEQKKIYESMIAAHEGEKDIIRKQIDQKAEAIAVLRSQQGTLAKNVQLAKQTFNTYDQLHSQKLLSDVRYIQVQKELNDYQGEYSRVSNEIKQAQEAIGEYKSRLASLEASHLDNARQQLDKLKGEIAQNQEIISKLQDKVARLEVRSPVRGLVKGLAVNTVGGVVRPGEPLMEIVPLDQKLVVEARIEPRAVGHLQIGQPVQVKVSSYDFSRYGAIPGKLDSISAITFSGEEGEKFYRGRVTLNQNHVGSNPNRNIVMPGMTVEADIITGEKSILAYLLKPIQVSMQTALTEK